jgi:hypothetical protein
MSSVGIYLFEVRTLEARGEVLRTASNYPTAVEIEERYRKKRRVGFYIILEIHQSFLFPLGLEWRYWIGWDGMGPNMRALIGREKTLTGPIMYQPALCTAASAQVNPRFSTCPETILF